MAPLRSNVRRHMKIVAIATLLSCWLTAGCSNLDHSKSERSDARQIESRKTVDGFSGWLLVASEEDFPEDLDTSVEHPSSLSGPPVVRAGESVLLLFFFANRALESDRIINVQCEFKVVLPDETVSVEKAGIRCYESRIAETVENKYVPGLMFRVVPDPSDPKGEWKVRASITDLRRGVRVPLQSSFIVK